MSRSVIIVIGAIILGFIALIAFYPKPPEAPKIGQKYDSEGQQHLQKIDEQHAAYKTNPPTSGPHYIQPAAWGVSNVEIPDEQIIHNLEHGGVVITYRPDLPQDQVAELQSIATNLTVSDTQESKKGFKVIVAPRAKNEKQIELTSWLWNYSLDSVDQKLIQQFYRDHLNNAPESSAV